MVYTLVLPQDGSSTGCEQIHRTAGVDAVASEAASVGPLHGFQRSSIRGESNRTTYQKEFVAFLQGLVSQTRWAKEIHVVLDNLSAHKTQDVQRFLAEHPHVRFHFTPTYSSWLNQVELWFAKIQRDVIRRGVFTSVADLGNKLRRYIRAYSKSAKPFRWTNTHQTPRIHGNPFPGTGQLSAISPNIPNNNPDSLAILIPYAATRPLML